MKVALNPNEHTRNMEFDKATSDLIVLINERQQKHDELLNTILDQVKRTNGRVTKIEEYRELVADPCIKQAKETQKEVAELCKFKEELITGGKTTKLIVGSVLGVLLTGMAVFYSYWVKDLSNSIATKVMADIEETYYFE